MWGELKHSTEVLWNPVQHGSAARLLWEGGEAVMPAVLGLTASHFSSITAEPRSWPGPSPAREGTYHLLKRPEPGSSGPPTSLHTDGDRLQTHTSPLCLSAFSITHEVFIVFPDHNGHRTGTRVSGSALEDTATVSVTGLHHPGMGHRTTVLPLAPSWTGEAKGLFPPSTFHKHQRDFSGAQVTIGAPGTNRVWRGHSISAQKLL